MNYSVSFYIVIIFTIKKIHLVFNSSLIPEKFMVDMAKMGTLPGTLSFEDRKTVITLLIDVVWANFYQGSSSLLVALGRSVAW